MNPDRPARVVILGNSGSGKTTLARTLAVRHGVPCLDLDTVAWEPGRIAAPRDPGVARDEVRRFCEASEGWVVEGCYAGLVAVALGFSPEFIFLDPGLQACLDHCRNRPWEPHKYASAEEQNARLPFLLEWVADYYRRDGDLSWRDHMRLFAGYGGPKRHVTIRDAGLARTGDVFGSGSGE